MSTPPPDDTATNPPAGDTARSASLGRAAVRGAATSMLGQAGRVVVQMVGVAILARLLGPAEYGLIAMVMVVIGVGELFRDLGLSSAAIQAPTLSRAQRDALTWINTAIGCLLGVLLAVSGPLIAAVYDQPLLPPLCAILGLTFLANGAATQYRAGLMRDLRFGALAVIDVVSPAVALVVAVVLAARGWGAWALAIQQVVAAVLMLVLVAIVSGWLPRRVPRDVELRGFLSFGGHLLVSQLVGYVANNVDTFIVGYRFGTGPLGLYSRAFQLLMQPYNQVRTPLTRVALPVFSRLGDDEDAYRRFLVRGQLCLGYTLVLGLALTAACAYPVTVMMLGEQWVEAAPLLALFAIAGAFDTLALVGYWVYLSRGLTRDLARWSWIAAAIKVACIVVGSQWGVLGVAVGYAAAPLVSWPFSLAFLASRTPLPLRELYGGALRIVAVTGVVGAGAWAAVTLSGGQPAPVQLALGVAAAAVAAALTLVAPRVRRDVAAVRATAAMIRR